MSDYHAETAVRGLLMALVTLAAVFATVQCFAGCAGTSAEAHARGALDLLADVIDPSYGLAMDSCVQRKQSILLEGESKRITAAEAERALSKVSARCQALRRAFDGMRATHAEAVELVERGDVARAEELLGRLRVQWRTLEEP
jgi:hypothetical protein